jgi:predicted nucleotide-binding protein
MTRRRPPEPSPIEVRQLTLTEIERGIGKLKRRIDEVRALDPQTTPYDDARVDNAEANIRETIREVFGPSSPEFHDHQFHRIWHGGIMFNAEQSELQENFAAGRVRTLGMLEGLIARLEEKKEDASLPKAPTSPSVAARSSSGRRVFVVHGHDEAAKEGVARFLEKLALEPVILHEQANQGRTVIEKFEGHAEVDFAVVLLTPDDTGYPVNLPDRAKPRARQNVVLELGYFLGRLGRARVCALYRGDVEMPSDFGGVVYISMDDGKGWRLSLAREIRSAGIDVDLNRAL